MKKYVMLLFIVMAVWIRCTTPTIEKTEADSGTTVELKKGHRLDVVLNANPTTGYQWEIVNVDTTILLHLETEYKPDEAPPGILGTGGKSIFHFQGGNTGKTALEIIYHRDFEENIPPIETFELTIIVQS